MTDMKVGELARATGLTVRTLHHYDEIGLLRPASRTPSGHRLYGLDEVERLQRIASLRHLGFSLEQVRDCLERPEFSLPHVLELHLDRVDRELERGARLRTLLASLRARVSEPGGASVEEITETIDATLTWARYYSAEQLEALEIRRAEVGEERIAEVQQEWQVLYSDFETAMTDGLPPNAPAVRALAERAAALISEFTGGDAGLAQSLDTMYRQEGGQRTLARHGTKLPDGLWEYMGEARRAYLADG